MLTFDNYAAKSKIHGFGLYADQDIKKGEVVWEFNPIIDRCFERNEFLNICKNIDPHGRKHLLNTCYKYKDKYYYITDNARFINHAVEGYNIRLIDENTEIALRDIKKGEEIIEDYNQYDKDDFFFYEPNLKDCEEYIDIMLKK
jgi:hypothetical protein